MRVTPGQALLPMSATALQFAILLDGHFVVRKLQPQLGLFPSGEHIQMACERIRKHALLRDLSLLRIYFYDAPPASGHIHHPLNHARIELGQSPSSLQYSSLHRALELTPDFALRYGECVARGWDLTVAAQRELREQMRPLCASDFAPRFEQKGVDMRIGLDIARLALCHRIRAIVIVTGDSDFVPALKFARREGVRVYLDTMGHCVRRELKIHADQVINAALPPRH